MVCSHVEPSYIDERLRRTIVRRFHLAIADVSAFGRWWILPATRVLVLLARWDPTCRLLVYGPVQSRPPAAAGSPFRFVICVDAIAIGVSLASESLLQ